MSLKLNLGACDRPFEGFVSVDIVAPADVVTDLSERWPWEDSTVDEVRAHDVIEHIADRAPLYNGRIHFMNELHRVMKPGAIAIVETPNAARGAGFFQDPTHRQPFCMNSFQYFEHGSFAIGRLARSYGITARFKIELSEREYQDAYEKVWKITAKLQAVK